MSQTQQFTGHFSSEQHQFNGNNFYGPVSFSAPHQGEPQRLVSTNESRSIFPDGSNGSIDQASELCLGESPSWDDCLKSLRAEELNERERLVDSPADGTCEWLLNSPEYLHWKSEHGLLLIRGKPGSGKSTLLKYALEKEKEYAAMSGFLVLSFFFHASGTELQNGAIGLFRSLILQLLDQDQSSRHMFREIWRNRWVTGGKEKLHMEWNEKELQMSFTKMVLQCCARREITIFVDAIDECGDQDRDRMIGFFYRLKGRGRQKLSRPRICFASRSYPDGQIEAEFRVKLEERNRYDIESFMEQELRQPDETSGDATVLKDILYSKAEGMFLWLVLIIPQVHDLSGKGLSFKFILSKILGCPRELNNMYEGLLKRIEDEELLEACTLFHVVFTSPRPLALDELRIVMNAQPSGERESLLDKEGQEHPHDIENDAKMKKRMIHLSKGLIDVTSATDEQGKAVVVFCHETVKDHLLKGGLDYLNGRLKQHQRLAKVAIPRPDNTHLLDVLTQGTWNLWKRAIISKMLNFPFYVAMYWL
ncbi:uncharacterized protein LDX57_010037 [Aspergillus melleus]|uniref:uncharacterized protein n=1 Tax=Aspergillus melleus TaxID=138277 RepID=UPI001E8E294E|nr:uncharacterized protein LDX57_010037 [Aspergillus melleus]KAH8432398.1 hypothetical protein LDX57_010037 [Aspergillus melleus]